MSRVFSFDSHYYVHSGTIMPEKRPDDRVWARGFGFWARGFGFFGRGFGFFGRGVADFWTPGGGIKGGGIKP